ncbi:MAG: hypothetical protein R3A50_13915 [Saprospiraceae bacterium]
MKRFCLLFLMACMAFAVHAQRPMPVMLISSEGKVSYKSPDVKKRSKVNTGAVLKRDGMVKLTGKSKATFLCDGKFVEKSGKGEVDLASVYPVGKTQVLPNFDLNFGDFSTAAFMMAASSNDPRDGWGNIEEGKGNGDGWGNIEEGKGNGDGWGNIEEGKGNGDGWGNIEEGKGNGDGWGGKGADVVSIQPYGKIMPKSVRFYWSKPAGKNTYNFMLKDDSGKVVFESTVPDTFLVVDLSKPLFKAGAKYHWNVSTKSDDPVESNTMIIEIGDKAGMDKAMGDAKDGDLYAKSAGNIQLVMQAVALESNSWFDEAAKLYEKAQKMDSKDTYVKLMHSAFWVRRGLKAKAREVYK